MDMINRPYFHCLLIMCVAVSIRLYNIDRFAEFRGDQGRDAMIIHEHWEAGTIPLLGPRVSTGQFPGPFFFYLIGIPLILFDFNPLAPTIFITILESLTVVPLYVVTMSLSNKRAAVIASLLYALSPGMIERSRIFWNPTTLPLFTATLFLTLYLYMKEQRMRFLFMSGILMGVIIQLHASAYFYVAAVPLFLLYVFFSQKKQTIRLRLMSGLMCLIGFLLPLLPYIFFEATHEFENIRGLFGSTKSPDFHLSGFVNILSDSMYPVIPTIPALRLIVLFLMAVLIILRKNNTGIVCLGLLISGTLFLTFLPGTIPDHYLSFIIILPFILTGIFFSMLNTTYGEKSVWGMAVLLVIVNTTALPQVMKPVDDIGRTTWAVETMSAASDGTPFAFVQLGGESVSDLHFRFMAKQRSLPIVPYGSDTFSTLFVICDSRTCRSDDEIAQARIAAMCYEKYCDREFPYIELTKWKFEESYRRMDITVYRFSGGPGTSAE